MTPRPEVTSRQYVFTLIGQPFTVIVDFFWTDASRKSSYITVKIEDWPEMTRQLKQYGDAWDVVDRFKRDPAWSGGEQR